MEVSQFLNRIDELIIFNSLNKSELSQIVMLQVERLNKRLNSKNLNLEISDLAAEWIAINRMDPAYGARPIKRAIQREIETPIAKAILKGFYKDGQTIRINIEANNLVIN